MCPWSFVHQGNPALWFPEPKREESKRALPLAPEPHIGSRDPKKNYLSSCTQGNPALAPPKPKKIAREPCPWHLWVLQGNPETNPALWREPPPSLPAPKNSPKKTALVPGMKGTPPLASCTRRFLKGTRPWPPALKDSRREPRPCPPAPTRSPRGTPPFAFLEWKDPALGPLHPQFFQWNPAFGSLQEHLAPHHLDHWITFQHIDGTSLLTMTLAVVMLVAHYHWPSWSYQPPYARAMADLDGPSICAVSTLRQSGQTTAWHVHLAWWTWWWSNNTK